MIAVDTSSLVSYFAGQTGDDVEKLDYYLVNSGVIMPPSVLSELLSDPKLPLHLRKSFLEFPTLPLVIGYWERVGLLRATALKSKRKSRLGDALIAQFCIDHHLMLITRDSDFKIYTQIADLKLST